jgi:CHASE2 domain-containing sensor protein
MAGGLTRYMMQHPHTKGTYVAPPDLFRPRVEVICINDMSIQKLGGWPFDRGLHARLVDKLVAAGARSIGFDIFFEGSHSMVGDRAFADAIRRSGRTWLIVENPAPSHERSQKQETPRLTPPYGPFWRAAGWRLAYSTINTAAPGQDFLAGSPLSPLGRQKIEPLLVGMMADYLHLRRWPYPNTAGDGLVFGSWVLQDDGGMFTAGGGDPRRLAIEQDSRVHLHSYWRVLQPDYPMESFKNALVLVGVNAEKSENTVIFEDWNCDRWVEKSHVEALGILAEKMLRRLQPPAPLARP